MKFLLIEDDNLKFNLVSEFLNTVVPGIEITRAASYQSGIENLVRDEFEYAILDMTLPVSDLSLSPVGVEFLPFGGQFILRECLRRKIKTKVIVVSQYSTFVRNDKELTFEQLREEIMPLYSELVVGCVRLDRTTDGWKSEISDLITT